MSKNVQMAPRAGWTVLVRGKMSESRFRTVRRPGGESVRPSGNAEAWQAVSIHTRSQATKARAKQAVAKQAAAPQVRPEELPAQPVTFARSGVTFETGIGEVLLSEPVSTCRSRARWEAVANASKNLCLAKFCSKSPIAFRLRNSRMAGA